MKSNVIVNSSRYIYVPVSSEPLLDHRRWSSCKYLQMRNTAPYLAWTSIRIL